MTAEELHARKKAYALGWKETGELLDAERRERVRQTETISSSELLDDAFESELWLRPVPRETSGMVEMEAIFARARQ